MDRSAQECYIRMKDGADSGAPVPVISRTAVMAGYDVVLGFRRFSGGMGDRMGRAVKKSYDKENQKPILKCSICTGEQVAGFKDLRTGKFEDVMLIRSGRDLELFKKMSGLERVDKEY